MTGNRGAVRSDVCDLVFSSQVCVQLKLIRALCHNQIK
jgi:hypothetical protein